MPAYTWISLGVFFLFLVGGTVWAAINALRVWRRARPALRRMTAESGALSERSTVLERRLAVLEPKTAQLQRDVARLSRSVARARLLLGAVKELQTVYRVARFLMP
jgi:hypothetical protein